jgi:UDP-N-acetylglucosamine 1-carboxyvinyltransferase
MDKMVIQGGRKLRGYVEISGSKNAALPILAATLLHAGKSRISNIPNLRDVKTMMALLSHLGLTVEWDKDRREVLIDAAHLAYADAPYDLVRTMRASVLVLGPLIARHKYARISLPGGCAIGPRPINFHIDGLEQLGAKINLAHGYVEVKADKLIGAEITLPFPSVTGTENLMMAATAAEGQTVIKNAAREPEVSDLAQLLIKMGVPISGVGTDTITIEGTRQLSDVNHRVIPDRIEAGTYLVAAGITAGEIQMKAEAVQHLDALIALLAKAGVECRRDGDLVVCRRRGDIQGINVETAPYPGFPTDMQAQIMALLTLARGTSTVIENIFENRFMHVQELNRMGANILVKGGQAVVSGVSHLSGAPVMATDLRASASLILAGLAAEGTTEIRRVYHLDRGYEEMEKKFAKIGAEIRREPDV